jgi:hypothetical protein
MSERAAQPAPEPPAFHQRLETVEVNMGGMANHCDRKLLERTRQVLDTGSIHRPVRLHMEKDRPFFDAVVCGRTGTPIVKVEDNVVTRLPKGWDHNRDSSAMEIVDEEGFPVLQIVLKDESHFEVLGRFHAPDGPLYVTKDRTFINPFREQLAQCKIEPLFKHPFEDHRFERVIPRKR